MYIQTSASGRWSLVFDELCSIFDVRPFKDGFVYIDGGSFRMGSPEGREDKQPVQRRVDSFWIGRHEVTVQEYAAYVRANGYTNKIVCFACIRMRSLPAGAVCFCVIP